jgi:uncharacterized protein (UPF0264 family)
MREITGRDAAPRAVSGPGASTRVEPSPENRAQCSPKLLVSVRSAAESLVALEGGASFIDIKEPASGSLGRAARVVQVEVVSALCTARERTPEFQREVTMTAALGELLTSGDPTSYSPVPGLSLYKLGLSDCGEDRDWMERLDGWRERLATEAADLASVAYADYRVARAPEPHAVLDYAIDRRLRFLLIDTYEKKTGSLRDFLDDRELATLLAKAHRHEVSVALAGSLRTEDVHALARMGTDVLAVRGAACKQGNRRLGLDPDRVRELVRLLRDPAI